MCLSMNTYIYIFYPTMPPISCSQTSRIVSISRLWLIKVKVNRPLFKNSTQGDSKKHLNSTGA